ncbi:hypothetical protein [Aromatoleum toluclasticum]|uniref:hypothetical protein n=1 Tax=Aromatoleum toluclasticum TaxID=92003 RepID=UPI0012FB6690|nr:hypothetical protein [Aromatoleum toluclasticum]
MEKKSGRVGLLRSMLSVLVDEWGLDAVSSELNRLSAGQRVSLLIGERTEGEPRTDTHGKRPSVRLTAALMAARVNLPPEQKQLVQTLAVKFDSKQFLPTSGDIKYFFEVHGEATPPSKQRIESFRRVLRLLSSLPEGALKKMIEDDAHSGPSSLAPLSDAIRGVGAQRSEKYEQSHPSSREIESTEERPDRDATSSDT